MFGATGEAQIDEDFADTSANMSNEHNPFPAEPTDIIVAREENVREECGSQYYFSTASYAIHQHCQKTS